MPKMIHKLGKPNKKYMSKSWDILYLVTLGYCFICHKKTHWVSISFEGYYCFSSKCDDIINKELLALKRENYGS